MPASRDRTRSDTGAPAFTIACSLARHRPALSHTLWGAYRLKRSTSSGGPYTTIATLVGTSYLDRGVTNGVTYYYVVGASNALGESGDSLEEIVTPTMSP